MQNTMTKQRSGSDVAITVQGLDPREIKTIRLSDGEHQVEDAELVQFVVGEAHSPISPTKVYPALRYVESGQEWTTPLSQITGFSAGSDQQSRSSSPTRYAEQSRT